jgi:protein-S-isoprenylcysteine O-methyltransferase
MTLSLLVVIFWLTFFIYWAVSAIGIKQNIGGNGSLIKGFGGRILLVILLLIIFDLPQFSGFWVAANHWAFFHNEEVRIIGIILTAAGIAIAIWARRHLGRNWSGRPTMKVGHELVTSGPYRFVRHPIYTGMLAALLGTVFAVGPTWLIVFIVFSYVFIWRIGVEERYMTELFPDQYPAYRARTRALIPFVW